VPIANLFDRLRQRRHDSVGPRTSKAFFRFVEVAGKSPNAGEDPNLRQVYADALAQRARLREREGRKRGDADHVLGFGQEIRQYLLEGRTNRQRKDAVAGSLQQLGEHRGSDFVGLIIRRQTKNANG
jgi:hypothetical protein